VSTTASSRPRAAVIGGSLAGLSAAVVLARVGYEATVYEQAAGPLSSRGAGIVLQPDVELLLDEFGVVDPGRIATSCSERQYLRADGRAETSLAMPQRFTAWNALYRHLRAAVGDERHHAGQRVLAVEDGEQHATLHFAGGERREAELVIAADGWNSSVRRALLPDVEAVYAGYLAWRGVAEERDLPQEILEVFNDRFTFFEAPDGGHCLCYLVPGTDGELEPGSRRLNWVWYINVDPGADLDFQLTDARGERRELSISPGTASREFVAMVHARARTMLPQVFAELVRSTREPFVQAIVDLASPRMAWQRVCLLGDAAFMPRPHTAASTAKAAGDVLTLADALHHAGAGNEPEALRRWAPERLAVGRALGEHGRRLGLRSQSGKRTVPR
jgi:2-polyprenyl-6-methoxyphenol hydroxylase-like FAD-dependent oxidoreductase